MAGAGQNDRCSSGPRRGAAILGLWRELDIDQPVLEAMKETWSWAHWLVKKQLLNTRGPLAIRQFGLGPSRG